MYILFLTIRFFFTFKNFSSIFYSKHILPILPALTQIAEGMDVRNLGQLLKNDSQFFSKIFMKGKNDLTFQIINDSLQPCFSPEGSNRRLKEMELFEAFLDFLENVSHQCKFFIIQKIEITLTRCTNL